MTSDSIQKLVNKLRMVGKCVEEVLEDVVVATSQNTGPDGYNEVYIYVFGDVSILSISEISEVTKVLKPNTKLIITGPGKPWKLIFGEISNTKRALSTIPNISKVVMDIDTSNITDMNYMFFGMSGLEQIEFKRINTQRVEKMAHMFEECVSLEHLDLRCFDTRNCNDMSYMFFNCENLLTLDLSSFKAHKLSNMIGTFGECRKLKKLDLSSFKTTKYFSYMLETFQNCSSLRELDISNFDLNHVRFFKSTFENCLNLQRIKMPPASKMQLTEASDLRKMFRNCTRLVRIDLSPVIGKDVWQIEQMFEGCDKLQMVILKNFKPAILKDASKTFNGCYDLDYLDLRNFTLSGDVATDASRYDSFIHTSQQLTLILPKVYEGDKGEDFEYLGEAFNDITDSIIEEVDAIEKSKTRSKNDAWYSQALLISNTHSWTIRVLTPKEKFIPSDV